MNSKALYMVLVLMAGAALVASGCTARTVDLSEQPAAEDKSDEGTSEAEDESAPAEQEAVASATPDRAERVTQTLPPGLEKVEVTPLEPMTGEVPVEILEAILADLVERTGTKSEDIVVVRAETAVWNDGTLGCPKPGEVYIQVLIDGYWVVLEVKGVEYDYRVSNKGSFKLCQGILSETPDINQPLDEYGTIDDPHPLLPIISGKTVKCKWPPCQ